MKDLLAVVLLVCAVSAERPAPYPARGWRPNGPAFELPQKAHQNPQTQYLPPLDPRNPLQPVDAEEDVSVQGLPATEQTPQFQLSPISGQQYAGPTFNADLRSLDERFRQSQTQQQTINEIARQRQLYTAPSQTSQSTPKPSSQFIPRTTKTPEATTETSKATTPNQDEISLNQEEILNDDDQSVPAKQKVSVEVSKQNIQEYPPEIFLAPLAQLRVQGYAGQPFGQLVFQPSLSESSQKQTVAPGFDGLTHLSALQSVLLQRQMEQQRLVQNQQLLQREPSQQGFVQAQYPENQYQPLVQPQIQQYQLQPVLLQSPAQLNQGYGQPEAKEQKKDDEDREMVEDQGNQNQPQFQQPQYVQQPQLVIQQQSYQPQEVQFQPEQAFQIQQQAFQPQQQAYQPQQQAFQPQQQAIQSPQQAYQPQQQVYQPQQQAFRPQQAFQAQQQAFQPQQQALQPQEQAIQSPQQAYQPQQQIYQPQQQAFQPEQAFQVQQQAFQPQQALQQQMFQLQQVYQPQQYQPQNFQPAQQQIYQPGLTQDLQQQQKNQVALQSGLDPNMQGNDIDQPEERENDEEAQGGVAVAMATAFGARTRPRVSTQYGVPVPRVQPTNTDAQDEEQEPTTEAAVIAEATSVANGNRRKSAKLRSRRVRPVFTLDNSGHLVLAKEQEKRQ